MQRDKQAGIPRDSRTDAYSLTVVIGEQFEALLMPKMAKLAASVLSLNNDGPLTAQMLNELRLEAERCTVVEQHAPAAAGL
jgi:hypothetical protein